MEISKIKERLSIGEVLQHYQLKPNRNQMLCCPFHPDKTPSLQVYPQTNTVYCFSANCKTHGRSLDVIDFIMHKENLSKHEAILKAQSLSGTEPVKKTEKEAEGLSRRAVLTKLFSYFTNGVSSSKPAQEYLKSRSLNYEKVAVGYNSGQFHHGKRKNPQLIESCLKYGLLIDKGQTSKTGDKAYQVFGNKCIVFALRDRQGQVVSLYFRNTLGEKGGRHYYLKDRQGLYPAYPRPETKTLILTESIIDAATLLQLELKEYSILALFGTNGLTEEHEKAIQALPELEEIIFFLNGDEAGRQATKKHSQNLQVILPKVRISEVEVPEGEDINSLAVNHPGEEKQLFTHLLESRKTISLFFSNEEKMESAAETVTKPVKQEAAQEPENEPSHAATTPKLNTENPEQLTYETEALKITIWGGIEKENLSRLKISLHIRSKGDSYKSFRDDVNLYSHQSTKRCIQQIAEALELSSTLISNTLAALTEQLEEYRLKERAVQVKALKPKAYEMTDAEKQQALQFLQSPELVKKSLLLISQSGLIGEQKNGLLLFFLYLSRFFDEPLHAIIFGRSGSGKTYLQTRISECLPEESVRTITSLTENTLYYSSKDFWKNKVLLIEDLDGVYSAFLPLREFMSKQSITKLTTDKDAKGNNVQKVLTVEGPICVSGATTKEGIYEDNANRSFLLHINESCEHLEEVMDYQRKLQAGLVDEYSQSIAKQLLKNTQRLLKPIRVINRYATALKIPDSVFKKLRTNIHYLRLIEIITFYHQYQREIKTDAKGNPYLETSLEDISWANRLVKESLLRKSDELNGQLRSFFESLKHLIGKRSQNEQVFYAKEIRETFRMNPMKTSRYLRELEMWGYIKKAGGNRKTGFEYQIIAWQEYEQLQSGIDILDLTLEKLREKEQQKGRENGKASQSEAGITGGKEV